MRAPDEPARLGPDARRELAAVLARAFWPDPLFGHFARSPVQEHRQLPIVFGVLAADAAPHGETWGVRIGGRLAGAALWLPPSALPRTRGRELRLQLGMLRALAGSRHRRQGLRLLDAVEARHPTSPHWYLSVLGTDPSFQRSGVGGALLRAVLPRVDEEGLPAYLETQKEENLAYYARFGFELVDEVRLPGLPPVWTMQRAARGALS